MATRKSKAASKSSSPRKASGVRARASAFEIVQDALGSVAWTWNVQAGTYRWFGDLGPLLGLPKGVFSGRFEDYLARTHPDDRALARQIFVDCLKGRRPTYRAEERVVWPDGTVRWLETYGRGRYGRSGRAIEMSGTVHDCTERKEQETAIARSEEMFARAFEAAPGYMSILRLRDGAVLHVNRAFEQAVGRTVADLRGRPVDSFGFWASPPQREAVRLAIANRAPVRDMPLDLFLADGRVANCLVTVTRIEYEGEPAAVTFARDVTEEQARQRALAESEERFEKAFTSSQEAIGISRSSDGVIVAVNPRMEVLVGAPAADLIGRTTPELAFWADGPATRDWIMETLRSEGRIREREMRVRRRDGELRTCDYSVEPIVISGVPHVIGFLRDVTDQRRMEREMRLALRKFSTLFESSPEGIAITRFSDGTILQGNDAAFAQLALDRAAATGRTAVALGIGADEADRREIFGHLRGPGRILNRPTRFRRYDGVWLDLLLSAVALDIDGEYCVVWSWRDVTDLLAAQRELQQSEHRYRSLFQAAMDCIIVAAPDGTLLDINEAGCRSLGYARDELRGGPLARIFDVTKLHRLLPRHAGVPIERRTVRAEQEVRTRDGSPRSVEFSAGPLPDGNVLIIVRDITDRKTQEALLSNIARGVSAQLGESFLNSLVLQLGSELGAGFVLIGVVQPGSDRVRTLAYCIDGAIAPNYEYPLAGSPSMQALQQRGTVTYAHGAAGRFAEDPGLQSKGIEGFAGTALQDSRGATFGILLAMTRTPIANEALWASVLEIYAARAAAEIERLRAEAEVRELNLSLERRVRERTAELEAANQELESFSYSVSHDLRAPLRAIIGFSGVLRERHGAGFGDEMRRLFGRIEENAARMSRLIDDLLEFSRTGRAELRLRPLEMRAIVDAVVAVLPAEATARVSIEIGELPDCDGDGALLRQVWDNLIRNAVKFSARAAAPRVEIGGGRSAAGVEYFVRDNGAGFDMEYAGKLFGVFERLHTASEFEGTGVGLAIVRRIVLRHGGAVAAEGAPGKGATFRFMLPG